MSTVLLAVALQAAEGPNLISTVMMVGSIFAIFYLLVFRPQQKKQSEHDAMLKTIQKGDRIVTSGGLHGVVVGTSDDVLTVDLGVNEKVRVKLDRSRIERRLEKAQGEGA
jgi:preprotein translocase subunit YajC